MKLIDQIRELLLFLPPKDEELCKKFLDGRKFIELKEIVDANVTSMGRRLANATLSVVDDKIQDSYVKLEHIYNNLKNLQSIVDEQAEAYMDDGFVEDDYYSPVYV